jgi:FG-GAP repeat
MKRNLVSPSAGQTVVQTLKVYEGGTGAVDAPTALVNLGAIGKAAINQPNGVPGLDSTGKMDMITIPAGRLSSIGLSGPSSMNKDSSVVFVISNYDVFTDYVVEAVGGVVSRSGANIQYTAPTTIGTSGFKINGRLISISVTDYQPTKPVLSGKANAGSVNQPFLTLTGAKFSMPGSSDTHKNTDWQIATDSSFATLVASSTNDTVNKTTFTGPTGAVNTTYYSRVRYRSSGDYVSEWSDTLVIRTAANYLVSKEVQKIVPPDRGVNQTFGFSMAMSADGSRMVITGPYNFSGNVVSGGAYIFVRSGNLWVLEAKLQNPVISPDDRYGYSCAIDSTGTRVVVCSYRDDYTISSTTYTDSGSAFVYVRSNGVWVLEGVLRPNDPSTNYWFGVGCGVSSDGSRVLVCAQQNNGGAYIFVRSGTTWSLEQKLTATTPAPGTAFYGVACCMSPDGLRATVCDYNYDDSGGGALYVFVRNGTAWAQEQVVRPSDPGTNARFGAAAVFDATSTRMAVSARGDPAKGANAGALYVFVRNGSVWTQETKLTASNGKAGDTLGTVFISGDGSRIAGGAIGAGAVGSPLTGTGAVYLWSRLGSSWTQDAIITSADAANGNQFGGCITGSAAFDMLVSSAIITEGSGAAYSFTA